MLRKALNILKKSLKNTPSTMQLAEKVGVSRATIDRLFASELGCSMHSEVMRMRIARSKLLLAGGEKSVAKIADECGFCNSGHFISVFRKSLGTTPAKWRRCYRTRKMTGLA